MKVSLQKKQKNNYNKNTEKINFRQFYWQKL